MTGIQNPDETGESPLAAYRIELEKFEGPLDLLLHLIQKNEVDIRDIPIAEITAQYLSYLEVMKDLDLEIASEFLVMASHLVYVKSRILLPVEAEEEEAEPEDPREELIRRLIEYRKYREAARTLSGRPALHLDIYPRPDQEPPDTSAEEHIEATLFNLMDAFQRVLDDVAKRVPVELDRDPFTLEDALSFIRERISRAPSLGFKELFTSLDTRRKVITVFLGVLEMIKRGRLIAVQRDFGEPITLVLPDKVERGPEANPPEKGDPGHDAGAQ